ncbi:MAG TPA: TlpA disulfide reductase family protein [Ferruginibacter sp.]|nr:TlpA disulfide reductase family protein [Ferruginibacter sp.]
MKQFKIIVVISILFSFYISELKPQNKIYGIARADSAWSQLEHSLNLSSVTSNFVTKQAVLLRYREEGLKFWKTFPGDVRRYNWLNNTISQGKYLHYLNLSNDDTSYLYREAFNKYNIVIQKSYRWSLNKEALMEWEKVYPRLREEYRNYYLNNPKLNHRRGYPDREFELAVGELETFLSLSLNKEYLKNGKMDLKQLLNLLNGAGNYLKMERYDSLTWIQKRVFSPMNRGFIARYKDYGLTTKDINSFLKNIQTNSSFIIKKWAVQQSNLLTLIENPLSFKHISISGEMIDMSEMRGKVVLVDFWNILCSDCIKRMPAIKSVYDKYKERGFVVISVCIDNSDKLPRVKEIEKKIGSEWPILLVGDIRKIDGLGRKIWREYGFWGVPQLLLLNKKGELVMLNNTLRSGDFEPIVKRLLDENIETKN